MVARSLRFLQPISATDLIGEASMELADPPVPRPASPLGGRDDELPHRWLSPLDGGLLAGTATSSTNKAHDAQHGLRRRHDIHQGALNDEELTRRLRNLKPSGQP
jgi:hypothetical protein